MTRSAPVKVDVREPKFCPWCGSTQVTTNSKLVDESTYFRCLTCSEIWNPTRLRLPQATARNRPW